ncbi:MAG: GNAT family N-acetyltransferase [Clostridia bacterium]|nr:GNAT family N-acetyltransferase [Clostridia bacterium]MDD4387424.1 GNAT family N-acetyltransferase [Clostridia bacterium]
MKEIIRKSKIEDSYSIAKIKVECWNVAYKGIVCDKYLSNLSIEKESKRRRNEFKDVPPFYVYEENSIIKGFVWFGKVIEDNNTINENIFEIFAIYVNPDNKCNGIGTKLINFAKNEAKKQNYSKVYLWCLKDNLSGRKFYEKKLGKLKGETIVEIGEQDLDEVRYEFNV